MKDGKKDFLKVILKLLILLASVIIVMLAINLLVNAISYFCTDDKAIFIIEKILNTLGIVIVIFLYNKDKFNLFYILKQQSLNNRNKLKNFFVGAIVLSLVVPFCLYIIGSMKFQGVIWQKFYAEDIIPVVILGIFDCLFESFFQEMIYRFAVSDIIVEKLNIVWAFIFSTIIYTASYAFDSNISIIFLINIALLNILMLSIYLKYKNIWICILSRTIFEYIISYGFSINRYGDEIYGIIRFKYYGNTILSGGTCGIYGSIVIAVVLLVLIWAVGTYGLINKSKSHRD